MIRVRIAALAAIAVFALSAPAIAQMGAPMGTHTQTNGTMSAGDSMPTTCQGMMDKAKPMMANMADGTKKTMAMQQMTMANKAMMAGHEISCMTHTKAAMHGMM